MNDSNLPDEGTLFTSQHEPFTVTFDECYVSSLSRPVYVAQIPVTLLCFAPLHKK